MNSMQALRYASIALRNGTMNCGESAANGLWDSEPPELVP